MTAKVFDAYSRYYDLLYRDKDYAAEVVYVQGLLEGLGVSRGDLLELGSGTGIHGCLLADSGFRVLGIERSPEMLAQVRSTAGFSCQLGDACTIHLGRSFDAVLALFHVLSYQTDNGSVQALFARAAEHLRPGGLFVFDFWYSPAVYAQRPAVRLKSLQDGQVRVTRVAEPSLLVNENRVDVHYRIFVVDQTTSHAQTLEETHSMRHFSLPEIDLLADQAGFVRLRAEEFLTGSAPGEDTWGLCVVLQKSIRTKTGDV